MPCLSDGQDLSHREIECGHVLLLLSELEGSPLQPDEWKHTHPPTTDQMRNLDHFTSQLCELLQAVDVTSYSLEMQIWWRDHQQADRERVQRELDAHVAQQQRDIAISKLTPYDRQLLGL